MIKLATLFGSLVIEISETNSASPWTETTEMAEYLSSLRQLETQLLALNTNNLNDAQQHTINGMLSHLIDQIEVVNARNPSSTDSDVQNNENIDFRQRIDSVIDSSITILTIAKDACSLAPPGFVKTSVGLACTLMKAVKQTRSNYEDMQELSATCTEFVLSLIVLVTENNIGLSETLENALKDFTSTLKDIVIICLNLSEKSLATRFLQQGNNSDDILRLKGNLQTAIQKFQMKAQILQSADFHRFSKIVIDKIDGDIIRSLPDNEFFEGSQDDFFPGIHDDVLTQIGTWIENPSFPVLWLCGSAGMGKSSIAHQVVYHLIDARRLGAQMFFTRGSDMQRNLVTVIHTLARELASMHPKTVPEIANSIRLGSSKHQELSVYLKQHIVVPIQSLSLSHPLVIILDALDECKNSNLLLKAIAEISDLSGIKILVTSRPEPHISNTISTIGGVQKINLQRLSNIKLELYISSRFSKINWQDQQPSENDLSKMAKMSDGLIIYAATACNFLGNEMQEEEAYQLLQKIVTCSNSQDIAAEHQLASLYYATLSHLFKGKDIIGFHQVFQPMTVVQDSMTVEIFAKTFKLGIRQTKAIHSALVHCHLY
ncbi:hypothetical protein HYPSUDRAFT_206258 [Hypholoma sublateritium FD-334 SS-4]|uniref:Nephrocystin 3-like N-terminal domain-containing protein n=1 Tax=Hypholoma sublateritium (strain FD-334 SS-4) TaxID=945553 RepID=A0A0D2M2C7_HYPSF|nr:hypothetical protein HYPSUDRAFT_206258 [Hypholoma sublateritium FD-334 SS-4]